MIGFTQPFDGVDSQVPFGRFADRCGRLRSELSGDGLLAYSPPACAMPYPNSLYAATAVPFLAAPSLSGDLACDVCVIGGGYTGLSAALHLAERGYDTVVLEAQKVGWGASGRNGGQLGGAQVDLQPDLARRYGPERAQGLWQIADAVCASASRNSRAAVNLD